MAQDAVLDKPQKVESAQPADNLHSAAQPTASDVRASNAGAQVAAQDAVENHFGGLVITDQKQLQLCQTLTQAPNDARSMRTNPQTGDQEGFIKKDGHAYALSRDSQGNADTCVIYANGTVVSAAGKFNPNPAGPNDAPIKPNDIQILSGGGKVQFTPGPDGKAIMHATDPQGNRQDFATGWTMQQENYETTRHPDFKITWAPKDANGVNMVFSSGSDSQARKDDIARWKMEHKVQ